MYCIIIMYIFLKGHCLTLSHAKLYMIKKIKKFYVSHPDLSALIVLSGVFCLIVSVVLVFKSQGGVWGSDKDWKSQHFAIPEYFRERFYKTHDLFPDLALQLGGGQNIYNYAYYGVANPLYLPAYAMPFMRMSTYIQLLSLATVLGSGWLSYLFFKRHFNKKTALLLAVMFLCSGGLMFHSHRHIMFMNYIPFLLWMLILSGKKDSPLRLVSMAVCTYCVMCCSFYFSVGSFAAVGAYMLYLELEKDGRFTIVSAFRALWKKIAAAALGCFCSAYLWVPVLSALLSGRAETDLEMSMTNILVPNVDLNMMLYTGYSVGMTSVVMFASLYLLPYGRRQDRFLSAILLGCTVFPLINYIVNAGMYIDGKAYIPLAPIALLACGRFLEAPKKSGRILFILAGIHILMAVLSLIFTITKFWVGTLIVIEYTVSTPAVLFMVCKGKNAALKYYTALTSLVICIPVNMTERFVPSSSVEEFYDKDIRSAVTETLSEDTDLYRFADCIPDDINVNRIISMEYLSTNSYSSVSNSALRDFRFETSLSENRVRNTAVQNQSYSILFNALMSCRYRIAPDNMRMCGEEPVRNAGDFTIYRNEFALPLGYASGDVMSEEQFFALPQELRAEALIRSIIIPEKGQELIPEYTAEIEPDMSTVISDRRITSDGREYTIASDTDFTVTAGLPCDTSDKFLIVTASADNRIGDIAAQTDIALTINGVKNKLSDPNWKYNNHNYNFTYVISSYEPVSELKMTFTKGFYRISELHVFTVDKALLANAMDNKDEFIIDRSSSLGASINGHISVSEDGWFTLSLPYDKGFHIDVDGEETDYFKTNTAFIGFPVSAGEHDITVTFQAPLKKEGLIVSAAGAVLLALLAAGEYISGRKNKKRP